MPLRTPIALAICAFLLAPAARTEDHGSPAAVSPEAARARLEEGNRRYATSAVRPRRYRAERPGLVGGQRPYAMVLSCADSRVPPEIVFDESLGRLFVIRVAGHVAGADELASVEYAVEHLGTRLLLVLGHGSCGAVTAALSPEDPTPSLAALLGEIRPAAEAAKAKGGDPAVVVRHAVEENVRLQVKNLTVRSEPLQKAVAEGRLVVAGAVYDLGSGKVEWLAP